LLDKRLLRGVFDCHGDVCDRVRNRTMDPRINTTPSDFKAERDLPPGFLDFFIPLHKQFTPRQQPLAAARSRTLSKAPPGDPPDHLPPSAATTGEGGIDLPKWVEDQRNQMTGPADDAELVVKMLNSGAPGVMLDLEDSVANFWPHISLGVQNILSALVGELTYFDAKRNQSVGIKPSKTVIWV